uniref:Uncharacterized protein n=1 Tax=Oryza sativa subsp. japonica TaxID=39947 RepID=Q6Z4W6_ORYSJ|nr:hypothetical protein [Oryza sativa Japonica Group]BAC99732.1 hypothetical protein [Oryza sativa Japonica Group]
MQPKSAQPQLSRLLSPPFLLWAPPSAMAARARRRHRRRCLAVAAKESPPTLAATSLVTTGINPTIIPYVRVLFLVPGGKVHQKLIQFRV